MTDKPDITDIASAVVAHNGNLRDRITAAIAFVDDWRGVTDPAILADAVIDAVIEAFAVELVADLGLRKETVYAWRNGRTYPAGTRYVTKWSHE